MAKGPHRKLPTGRARRGKGVTMGSRAKPTHTPVVALRIPVALIAKADALVPEIAAAGEVVNPTRSTVIRLALAEGLRVLTRRYAADGV